MFIEAIGYMFRPVNGQYHTEWKYSSTHSPAYNLMMTNTVLGFFLKLTVPYITIQF